MTPAKIFQFREESPPTTEEFRDIGHLLASELEKLLLGNQTVLRTMIEEGSWINSELFLGDKTNFSGDTYLAIVSYAFRDQSPKATAVLLKFENGKRSKNGARTILTATFSEAGWGPLEWQDDEYDEWECDHVSEIAALKG
jgi:hypothetical protein